MLKPNDHDPYAPLSVSPRLSGVTLDEAPVQEQTPAQAEEKFELPEDVNTIKEIIAWVGTDTDKALLVLEHEEASENPRKGLVAKLEEIING